MDPSPTSSATDRRPIDSTSRKKTRRPGTIGLRLPALRSGPPFLIDPGYGVRYLGLDPSPPVREGKKGMLTLDPSFQSHTLSRGTSAVYSVSMSAPIRDRIQASEALTGYSGGCPFPCAPRPCKSSVLSCFRSHTSSQGECHHGLCRLIVSVGSVQLERVSDDLSWNGGQHGTVA